MIALEESLLKNSRQSLLIGGASLAATSVQALPEPALATTSLVTAFGWISNVEYARLWTALEHGHGGGKDFFVLSSNPCMPFHPFGRACSFSNWMVALRIAAQPAVLSAMVAEFMMGTSGLAHMFREAATNFQTDRAYDYSLVATCFGDLLCYCERSGATGQ